MITKFSIPLFMAYKRPYFPHKCLYLTLFTVRAKSNEVTQSHAFLNCFNKEKNKGLAQTHNQDIIKHIYSKIQFI